MTRPAPRSRRGTTALLAAVTASALVLAACGGGGDAAASDEEGDLDDPRSGPLAQLLGFGGSTADQRARDLEVQQQMAECMRDEGFEYRPVDWQAQSGDLSAEWELQLSDPEAYGEKYGYGAVRSYETQEMSPGTFEDPNAEYMESLTPDEMEAYQEALYGQPPEPMDIDDGGGEFTMPPLEEQGCYGAATLAVYGENSPMTNSELQSRVSELFESAESDPEVSRAYEDWAACMREQDPSSEWDRPDDVMSEFYARISELQGFGQMTEGGDDGAVIAAGTVGGSGGPTEIDEADLEELRQDELRTWRHDWDCQQEADLAQVRRDAEQRIVDELLEEFPELQGS